MAGQMAGVPWYCDDGAARQGLTDLVQRFADGGIDRIVIGVPVDSVGHLEDALAVLADLCATASRDGDHSPASSVRG
jgi:hypothetical protein